MLATDWKNFGTSIYKTKTSCVYRGLWGGVGILLKRIIKGAFEAQEEQADLLGALSLQTHRLIESFPMFKAETAVTSHQPSRAVKDAKDTHKKLRRQIYTST